MSEVLATSRIHTVCYGRPHWLVLWAGREDLPSQETCASIGLEVVVELHAVVCRHGVSIQRHRRLKLRTVRRAHCSGVEVGVRNALYSEGSSGRDGGSSARGGGGSGGGWKTGVTLAEGQVPL